MIAQRLLCATGQKHQYEETQIIVSCAGESFSVKGKTITEKGWKAVEEQYRKFCAMKESTETEKALPEVAEGQSVPDAVVTKTEHDTTPPKPYSEDTLLSAMETAGNKEFEEGTEKKGLGTLQREPVSLKSWSLPSMQSEKESRFFQQRQGKN